MTLLSRSLVARFALVCFIVAGVSLGQAQSTIHLDKHARKIHHKLTKYPSGRYLHLVLRNDTDSYGALGMLSPTSFTFTSAENNATTTYTYNDVDKVKTDKERIGEGSEPRRHIRHLMPIAVSVVAMGTAGAIYAVER